jgi:hypothetical protein
LKNYDSATALEPEVSQALAYQHGPGLEQSITQTLAATLDGYRFRIPNRLIENQLLYSLHDYLIAMTSVVG